MLSEYVLEAVLVLAFVVHMSVAGVAAAMMRDGLPNALLWPILLPFWFGQWLGRRIAYMRAWRGVKRRKVERSSRVEVADD